MDSYKLFWSRFADFSGRSRRKDFWIPGILHGVIVNILGVIDSMIIGMPILASIISLILIIPSLAVWIRRLHDIGRSGWFLLIVLIPVVGVIILLIFMAKDSQPGQNKYGPNPKGVGEQH